MLQVTKCHIMNLAVTWCVISHHITPVST